MKVFFNPRMSVDSRGYSPSGSKPALVVANWLENELAVEICDFKPATEHDICLAHDPKFVRDVLSLRTANGHRNRIAEVTESTLWTSGSMIAASRQAIADGVACSPTSGFHHAHYASNGAFCTFNSLIVAARTVINEGLVERVGIVDCDAHYGDGTADILNHLDLHDRIDHWTFGGVFSRRDFNQRQFLGEVIESIETMQSAGVGLIVFQAAADPWINDPLGGFQTTEELKERDRFVFEACKRGRLPIVWNLAGGYSKDATGTISPVLELHRTTMRVSLQTFG